MFRYCCSDTTGEFRVEESVLVRFEPDKHYQVRIAAQCWERLRDDNAKKPQREVYPSAAQDKALLKQFCDDET